jgi:hypothetical protein
MDALRLYAHTQLPQRHAPKRLLLHSWPLVSSAGVSSVENQRPPPTATGRNSTGCRHL